MPEPSARLLKLIDNLLRTTASKSSKWEPVTNDPNGFMCSLNAGYVAITSIDHDGAPPIRLIVYDKSANVVESIDSTLLELDEDSIETDWSDSLYRLYSAAREQSSPSNQTLDAMNDELTHIDDIPF